MSAELMKSNFVRRLSSVVCRPSSVVRPSVCGIDYLWSYCMYFFQILVVASPGPYAQTFFTFLKKKNKQTFSDFLRIFFVFVNMGPYGSKTFKTLLLPQITFESFKVFSSAWLSADVIVWDFFPSNFSCGFPWAICPNVLFFFNFWNNFFGGFFINIFRFR